MDRITEKDGEFYKLKPENEAYGWENGIRLVQIVGKLEDLKEEYEKYCVKEKALKELFENHIELVVEKDRCYFKIKNSKGKEKSFTSYTMLDFWKEVLK